MNKPFPMCSQHRFDCFACERGRCVALGDTKFDGSCPFYKPKAAKVETPDVAVKLASAFNEINVGGKNQYGFFK